MRKRKNSLQLLTEGGYEKEERSNNLPKGRYDMEEEGQSLTAVT